MSESHYHRDEFERMLKEAADQLSLTPAPGLWKSLYNNLHPGRKLPSFGMMFLFSTVYLILGVGSHESKDSEKKAIHLAAKNLETPTYVSFQAVKENEKEKQITNKSKSVSVSKIKDIAYILHPATDKPTPKSVHLLDVIIRQSAYKNHFRQAGMHADLTEASTINDHRIVSCQTIVPGNQSDNKIWAVGKKNNQVSGLSYQIYAAPSILLDNPFMPNRPEETEIIDVATSEKRNSATMNFEAGGNIIVPINPNIRLKAGVQFNYYKKSNDQNGEGYHQDNEEVSDAMSVVSDVNSFSEKNNADKAISRSCQFSVPIGADVLLAGDEFVQWYAGATIQPGLYMSPSDNEVKEKEMDLTLPAKKWNMHGGLETFINLRISRAVNVNFGPQFRYEILSANTRSIHFYERPFQIGFKCGVTTAF